MAGDPAPVVTTGEVAGVAKDFLFPAFQGVLRHQADKTLTTRGGGWNYEIYDDLERDCVAFGLMQKRKLAVIARPWQVDPASDDPKDKQAGDVVRKQLEEIGVPSPDNAVALDTVQVPSNFDLLCYNLLDALLKGFAVGEVMWERDGNQVVARRMITRDQRRFLFDVDYRLRLKTLQSMMPGEQLPPRKFIVHSYGGKDGSPYGLGLGSRLFWPVFFKRNGITFWSVFLDKYGSPTAIGKYPAGTQPDEKQKLMDALAAIAREAGIAIPDGMLIELLEATRSGSISYAEFCHYMDEQMGWAVLGEPPASRGGGGAQVGAAILRNEVRLELVQADADLMSATLNSTLIPWISHYNCPGARPPKVSRLVKADEDLKARSERDRNLFGIGFRPTLKHVEEVYGGEWEEVPTVDAGDAGLDSVPKSTDPSKLKRNGAKVQKAVDAGTDEFSASTADTASFADQVALDTAIADLPVEALQGPIAALLKPVIKLLQQGGDPEAAKAKLAGLLPDLDTADLEELLARAMFAADVWGRISAQQPASA